MQSLSIHVNAIFICMYERVYSYWVHKVKKTRLEQKVLAAVGILGYHVFGPLRHWTREQAICSVYESRKIELAWSL